MYHPSHLQPITRARIIATQQTGAAAYTPAVAADTARALASIRAYHAEHDNDKPVELPMDATLDALREVANMSPEEEAEWNRKIEAGEV